MSQPTTMKYVIKFEWSTFNQIEFLWFTHSIKYFIFTWQILVPYLKPLKPFWSFFFELFWDFLWTCLDLLWNFFFGTFLDFFCLEISWKSSELLLEISSSDLIFWCTLTARSWSAEAMSNKSPVSSIWSPV